MANQEKQTVSTSIISSLEKGSNFAIITFDKITHQALESIRKELHKKNTTLFVVKNTIFQKAVNIVSAQNPTYRSIRKSFFPLKDKNLLMTFSGDWAEGLKTFAKLTKDNELISFRFGKIDETLYSKEDMVKLSQLPAKPELVAKLLGTLMNPVARTTRVLSGPMQQFVYVLSQQSQKS